MTLSRITSAASLVAVLLGFQVPALAQNAHADHGHGATQATPTAAVAANPADLADGEVRRIDAANSKVTVRHGEIKSLDMPPMTMVFTVQEPDLLTPLKVGDKIRFAVESQNGKMVITKIVPAS